MNRLVACGAVIFATLAGCADPGYKQGDNAAGAARAASAEAISVQTSVDHTTSALRDLMASQDVDRRPRWDIFSANLEQLKASIAALDRRTDTLVSAANTHLRGWEADLKQVKSDDLRFQSQQRKSQVEARVQRVEELSKETDKRASAALTDFEDVRRVLGTDLTVGGIATVKDAAARAEASGASLKEAANTLTAELDALAADIASRPADPAASSNSAPQLPDQNK